MTSCSSCLHQLRLQPSGQTETTLLRNSHPSQFGREITFGYVSSSLNRPLNRLVHQMLYILNSVVRMQADPDPLLANRDHRPNYPTRIHSGSFEVGFQ